MPNRQTYLNLARDNILEFIGPFISVSSVYETEPWGFSHPTPFLNQLIISQTLLSPGEVISMVLEIESNLGRQRREGEYSERTIDIDILFYDDLVINSKELIIPHPRLHERRFALEPLAELEPEFLHPVFNKTISRLLVECPDKNKAIKL